MGADGKLSCDALLTVEDFQRVCKAKVVFSKLPNEGEDATYGVCSRQIGVGDEFPFGNFMFNVYKSPESASAQWTSDTPGAKDVKGIGARQFEKLRPELTLAPTAGAKPASRPDAKSQAVAAKADAKLAK
jgi:hypothetical protein